MTHSYVGLHTCKGGPHLEQTIRETDESGNLYKYMYPRRGTPFPIRPQTNPNSKNTPLVPARITIFPHSPIHPISTFTLQRLLHLLPALWRGGVVGVVLFGALPLGLALANARHWVPQMVSFPRFTPKSPKRGGHGG